MAYSTKYLYNLDPKILINMPYKEAVELKTISAKTLLHTLVQLSFKKQDDNRIRAVHKAIDYNKQLLEELKC